MAQGHVNVNNLLIAYIWRAEKNGLHMTHTHAHRNNLFLHIPILNEGQAHLITTQQQVFCKSLQFPAESELINKYPFTPVSSIPGYGNAYFPHGSQKLPSLLLVYILQTLIDSYHMPPKGPHCQTIQVWHFSSFFVSHCLHCFNHFFSGCFLKSIQFVDVFLVGRCQERSVQCD